MNTMNEERLGCVLARAEIMRQLAVTCDYPDDNLAGELATGAFWARMTDALGKAGLDTTAATPGAGAAETLLDLEKDYTWMCFASKPRQVYLFESVYREGKLLQESTFEVARLYHEAGLRTTEDFRLPPDHIAVELEFLSFLCFMEAEALRAGSADRESLSLRLQGELLERHLVPFGRSLAGRMEKSARTLFYRNMAGLLRSVLETVPVPAVAAA
jgi:TorA maturation chaperone TorD